LDAIEEKWLGVVVVVTLTHHHHHPSSLQSIARVPPSWRPGCATVWVLRPWLAIVVVLVLFVFLLHATPAMSSSAPETDFTAGMTVEAIHPDHGDWRAAIIRSISANRKHLQVEFVTGNPCKAMVTQDKLRLYSLANLPEGLTAEVLISNKLGELVDMSVVKGKRDPYSFTMYSDSHRFFSLSPIGNPAG